jgi:hypothetical protein
MKKNLGKYSAGQYIAALRAKYESNLWNNVVEIANG